MTFRLTYAFSATLLFATVAIKAAEPSFLRQFEHQVFDQYQHLRPRPYEPAPVRIIDIDDESLKQLGQWPWPRTQVASLVRKLHEAGAAAIAFDIVFAEPDRTSPKEMLKIWGAKNGIASALAGLPDPDTALADAIAHDNVITGFVLTHGGNAHPPIAKAGIVMAGENALPFVPSFGGSVNSLPAFENTAAGNGALNSAPDGDGILRRAPVVFRFGDTLYPSLSAEAMRVAQGGSTYVIKTVGGSGEKGTGHGITAVRIGSVTVPTDAEGGLWIYFTKPAPQRYIPAWRILNDDFDHDAVNGNIVLIGTSAAGLKDVRATPLDPAAAGVEVHAQAIEQALLGISLSRPDWIKGAEICLMALAALLMMLAARSLKPLWSAALMFVLLAAAAEVSWQAFAAHRLLVEPITAMLAVGLIYFSETLGRYVHSEKERRHIRHAFSHYMAPALVEDLARHPEKLTLGGESRVLSVMFCDVRGFTAIAEQMNPVELTRLMNRFLTPMTDVVLRHQGTINKYIGDCIMAFWNAPIDDPHHARHAAQAALGMLAALKPLNEQRHVEAQAAGQNFLPLRIGIGINTGECCVGNMGSDQRFNFSALGDEVNLASRLEGLSKLYGVDIVLGDATAAALSGMALLELDVIRVQGKQNAERIFALLGDADMAQAETFLTLSRLHMQMLEKYRTRAWDEALALTRQCRQSAAFRPDGFDTLYSHYGSRCTQYRRTPPTADWDGVWEASSK